MRNHTIAFGSILAAFAPGMLMLFLTLPMGESRGSAASLWEEALSALGYSFIAATIPTLLLGVPYIVWLRSRGALTWLNVCIGSAVVGALTLGGLNWLMAWNAARVVSGAMPFPDLWVCLRGAGLGLAGGLTFCLAARPDKLDKQRTPRG